MARSTEPFRPLSKSELMAEVNCVLSWDERARKAYVRALKEYQAAGSPGIPLGSRDYRKRIKDNG